MTASRWSAPSYNPISNELFTAARGQGAQLNQKPIHVSEIATLSKSLLSTGFPAHKRTRIPIFTIIGNSHCVRTASAAPAPPRSISAAWPPGRFDGFWEFGLKSWDTAAGILIVREAGGTVTDFAGRPGHPGDQRNIRLKRRNPPGTANHSRRNRRAPSHSSVAASNVRTRLSAHLALGSRKKQRIARHTNRIVNTTTTSPSQDNRTPPHKDA